MQKCLRCSVSIMCDSGENIATDADKGVNK